MKSSNPNIYVALLIVSIGVLGSLYTVYTSQIYTKKSSITNYQSENTIPSEPINSSIKETTSEITSTNTETAESPTMNLLLENLLSNEEVKNAVEKFTGSSDVESLANDMCKKLEENNLLLEQLDEDLMHDQFGDDSDKYVSYLKIVDKFCEDGILTNEELSKLINETLNLNLNENEVSNLLKTE